jgi:hypothetical protein
VAQQLAILNRIITTWQATWTSPQQSPEIGLIGMGVRLPPQAAQLPERAIEGGILAPAA